MIDKLRVRNFRCLRDVEVPLGPLNFLVGPNNTGKSSFLEAIELLSRCMRSDYIGEAFTGAGVRLDRVLTQPGENRLLEYSADVSWAPGSAPGCRAHYELALGVNPTVPEGRERVLIEREALQLADAQGNGLDMYARSGARQSQCTLTHPGGSTEPLQLYGLHCTIPRSLEKTGDTRLAALAGALRSTPKYSLVPGRVAQPCQLVENAEIASDGFGLASCLDNLHQSDPIRFAKIEDALRLLVPGVQMVRFPAAGPGMKTILIHEKSGTKVYASESSDGLLLLLAHLTIAFAHADVGVVLVEEPETGVHSRRLVDIVHVLRAMGRGELGLPRVQVIATSHSPLLLDSCEKDEIVVFQRDDVRGAYAAPLATVKDIDERLKDFSPGELLTTSGERICESRS